MPHPPRAIPIDEWPGEYRAAWTRATTEVDPLDEPGLAAHWRPNTQHTVRTRFGFYLAWLNEMGRLDASAPPGALVTRENLAGYMEHLQLRRLASVTIAGYVRDIREAVRAMQPNVNLSLMDHTLRRLEAVAAPSRDKRAKIVSPALLLDAAIAEMTLLDKGQQKRPSRRTAGRFRDALFVAFLATRPLRRANFTAMRLGTHVTKRGGLYWCKFRETETKEGQPLEFPMPQALTVWLDRYIDAQWPLLLSGAVCDHLWISTRSTPIVDNTIYCRVTYTTERLLGSPINPHLFRDCAATFIAEELPEQVKIIARILGHATLATSEDHYNHAGMLSAQRRYFDAWRRYGCQSDRVAITFASVAASGA